MIRLCHLPAALPKSGRLGVLATRTARCLSTAGRQISTQTWVQSRTYGHPAAFKALVGYPTTHGVRLYSAKSYPPHTVINMPALSPTMTSGNIGSWQKQVGDEVVPGDVLVEIETDKAQMDFECQDEGYIAKILMDSGSKEVAVGQPIAVLVEEKGDADKFADFVPESTETPSSHEQPNESAAASKEEAKPETVVPSSAPAAPESSTKPSSSDRVMASPLAKTMAREKNISLEEVKGTGPNGRIVKADIEQYQAQGGGREAPAAKAAPAPSAPSTGATTEAKPTASAAAYTDTPVSNMRRVIATRLTESKQQHPHYYLTVEVTMDKINKLRAALNETANGEYKLSINDFIIKASAQAMHKVPEVNSAWHGDFIRQHHTVDISVATATPSGLITPIIFGAETQGLAGISNTMKELAGRARANSLKPHEYQGGTFTLSNLGMLGIDSFTAIINPPSSCILAIGTSTQKLVPDATAAQGFKVVSVMKATMSCDHRVVDGAVGAQWLKAWKELMENPLKLLL